MLEMSTRPSEGSPSSDATENRRWLIGISISIVFGIFGVVMALLSYSERTKPAGAPAVTSRDNSDSPRQDRRKNRDRN